MSESKKFSVATWNVLAHCYTHYSVGTGFVESDNSKNARHRAIVQRIKQLNCDVYLLQEVDESLFPMTWTHVGIPSFPISLSLPSSFFPQPQASKLIFLRLNLSFRLQGVLPCAESLETYTCFRSFGPTGVNADGPLEGTVVLLRNSAFEADPENPPLYIPKSAANGFRSGTIIPTRRVEDHSQVNCCYVEGFFFLHYLLLR
jgi:hypothetical protein